jgi:GT2 family glycosyltransferase
LPQQIDISIIIVSYNCLGPLKVCLDSISAQDGVSREIIVVDNASSDGTAEFLNSLEIRKAVLQRNIGFGAGINLGQGSANGAFLFFLNPDTILPPGTLRSLYNCACRIEKAGLISPLITWADGTAQLSARGLPTRLDFLFGRGSPLFKLGFTGEMQAGYIQTFGEDPISVPAVSATAVMIKTELFRSLGGFDQRFFMYLEDIDLCKRIGMQGLGIWLLPEIKIIHGWRQSSKTRPYFTAFHHHLSVLKYFMKHYRNQPVRNLLLAVALAFGFLASSLLTFFGRGDRR